MSYMLLVTMVFDCISNFVLHQSNTHYTIKVSQDYLGLMAYNALLQFML